MSEQRRRIVLYATLVVGIVITYTLVYNWGMAVFEDRPQTVLHSFVVVVETFTTTGYGEDAPWIAPQMQALVVLMQFTGVFVIFLTLPLFVAPWVERRLETSVPTSVSLSDHVVLCELSSRGETLIDEFETWNRDYVVVEPDRDRAATLMERGLTVIHGNPESTETLQAAGVAAADAVIADATDARNASVVLSAREVSSDVHVVAVVEDHDMADYLKYAGADEVFSPRRLLGGSLANEVTSAISSDLGDTVDIGDDFELVELPVQEHCAIEGVRLEDSGIRERTGVNVIGFWRRGDFESVLDPDMVLDRETILLVAGTEEQLEELKRLTLSEERRHARGTVLIAGHGEVGSTVGREITRSEMDGVVIDLEDRPGVDVVGDATREETLREAGIEDAQALIVALADDTSTMLATLVAREIAPELQIVARADETESVGKVYRAGADYVLALATVSGRMIASTVLDEEVVSPDTRLEIVRTSAPGLIGRSIEGIDIRSRTGCTVIAVERNGQVVTDVTPDLVIQEDDTLILAGPDDAINRFNAIAQ